MYRKYTNLKKKINFLYAKKHFQLCLAPLETPHNGTSLHIMTLNIVHRIGYLVRGKRLEDMASNGPFLAAEYFVIVFTPLNIASPKKALFATIAKKSLVI